MAQQRIIPSGANQGKASATVKREPRKTAVAVNSGNPLKQLFDAMARSFAAAARKQSAKHRRGWSRYQRHQGEQEKARRVRQIAKGMIHVQTR